MRVAQMTQTMAGSLSAEFEEGWDSQLRQDVADAQQQRSDLLQDFLRELRQEDEDSPPPQA